LYTVHRSGLFPAKPELVALQESDNICVWADEARIIYKEKALVSAPIDPPKSH
jgi:hypothetical protein